MWNLTIAGEDLYHILCWFFLYSFIGWVWESAFVSIRQHRLVNRGFVTGPVCTIYGCGGVLIYLMLKPVAGNIILLYLGGVVVPTIVEYVTAVLMEAIFHTSWWDYSNRPFNFQGRICLGASVLWGFFSIGLVYVLHPLVNGLVDLVSRAVGELMLQIVMVVYAFDFGIAWISAKQIGEKLRRLDVLRDELFEYLQSTKLYESTTELKTRLSGYRIAEYTGELRHRLEERMDAMLAFGPGQLMEDQKKRLYDSLEGLQKFYEQWKPDRGFMQRTMNAYPNMKSRAQALLERSRKGLDKDEK